MVCMLYVNKPEKVALKSKYPEKRVYKALKVAYPLECRNIKETKKDRNVHFRFN